MLSCSPTACNRVLRPRFFSHLPSMTRNEHSITRGQTAGSALGDASPTGSGSDVFSGGAGRQFRAMAAMARVMLNLEFR